jgi:hypothetical protein
MKLYICATSDDTDFVMTADNIHEAVRAMLPNDKIVNIVPIDDHRYYITLKYMARERGREVERDSHTYISEYEIENHKVYS